MSNKNLIAAFIAFGMAIWLFSGELASNVVNADENVNDETMRSLTFVRAMRSTAELRSLYLEVSGQTKANRTVQVKAEVSGRVEEIAAEKGTQVKKGDLLCRISVDTRQSDFKQTQAEFLSAELEYKGILDLSARGLQSDINVAKTKAALEGARARNKRAQLALEKINVVAPFAGVVESQPVEIGDFLNVGQICVSLMEIDPVLVVGQVAEKSIGAVKMGGLVNVVLITGDVMSGKISFIGRSPDAATRTYPIEITVTDPGENIRAGLTAHMKLPLGQQSAHLISAASLVLDDEGIVGVRIVDAQNIVHFKPVQIISEESNGIWISGLDQQVNLITIGHEDVFEGQRVKVDLTPLGTIVNR